MRDGRANEYVKSQITHEVIQRSRQTLFDNYGVTSTFDIPGVREKAANSCIEKFGFPCSMSDPEVRSKKERTFIEKYGVHAPVALCSTVVSRSIETQIQKYGSLYSGTPMYKEQFKRTSLERYGVEHPMHSDEIKSKIDFKGNWIKQHQTKKDNGTYAASTVEKEFGDFLREIFGQENVQHQILTNNWAIDFYIQTYDTFIQFDGVYWHGLDRSVDVISKSDHLRDKRILETLHQDEMQNEWFKSQNLALIRITDVQFKTQKDQLRIFFEDLKNGRKR